MALVLFFYLPVGLIRNTKSYNVDGCATLTLLRLGQLIYKFESGNSQVKNGQVYTKPVVDNF